MKKPPALYGTRQGLAIVLDPDPALVVEANAVRRHRDDPALTRLDHEPGVGEPLPPELRVLFSSLSRRSAEALRSRAP
jgi:hypothetical protein